MNNGMPKAMRMNTRDPDKTAPMMARTKRRAMYLQVAIKPILGMSFMACPKPE